MALDNQTVQTIARLAKLEIAESDLDQYRGELSNILTFVEQLESADTQNTAPMTHPFDATLRLREDQITEENQREKFQNIAPDAERGLYLVPKVID